MSIKELVDTAGRAAAEESRAKKEAKKAKDELRDYLYRHNQESAKGGEFSVKLTTTERRTMDEDKLLNIVEELVQDNPGVLPDNLIITKKSVNEEVLEKLVYDGVIVEEDLEEAIIVKEVTQLRFKGV